MLIVNKLLKSAVTNDVSKRTSKLRELLQWNKAVKFFAWQTCVLELNFSNC